jgi:hypothetical protein
MTVRSWWLLAQGHLVGGITPRVLASIVPFTPDPNALPGGSTLEQLVDGIGFWALIIALAGLVVGAAAWAIGSHTNSYQQASSGRRAVLVSGAAALIIGAAPTVINFLYTAGRAVH